MREETISRFLGKYVKIVKSDGFVLIGTIDDVYSDAILFTTEQTTSLISLDSLREVVLLNGREQ
ncbi:MAG: hypothetical protein KAR64_04060 [Thermoplasmatales archaeon]|nr:hypothetical protein [Thermoplasmatales archaeon]